MKNSFTSSIRQGTLLMEYSLSPSRKRRRETVTSQHSPYAPAKGFPSLNMVIVTSAMPRGGEFSAPLNITSSIFFPRSVLTRCSPITQRRASTILLLPHPLGPTTPLIPGENSRTTLSRKVLNPLISSLFNLIFYPAVAILFVL